MIWRQSSEPMDPPAPVDQHDLAGEIALDADLVEMDLLASQQILIADIPERLDRNPAADDIRQGWQLLDADLGRLAGVHHLAQQFAVLGGADQDLLGLGQGDDPRHLRHGSEHGQAMNAAADPGGMIIGKPHDAHARIPDFENLLGDARADIIGADNQHGHARHGGNRTSRAEIRKRHPPDERRTHRSNG